MSHFYVLNLNLTQNASFATNYLIVVFADKSVTATENRTNYRRTVNHNRLR